MNRSERYRSRNKISAKKNSKYRALSLLALALLLALLICNPLVNVKDFSFTVPFSPLNLQERISNTDDNLTNEEDFPYEASEDLLKTIVINSSIEESANISPSIESTSEGTLDSDTFIEGIAGFSTSSGNSLSEALSEKAGTEVYGVSSGFVIDADSYTRPAPGQIFESSGKGSLPQLTVVAPSDQDVYVKLKDTDTGKTVLSFYVRAGYTVKACIPVGYSDFFYALGDGDDWLGTKRAFGDNGIYAKADRPLNFTNPLNNYTYRFNVDDGNISPVTISEAAF